MGQNAKVVELKPKQEQPAPFRLIGMKIGKTQGDGIGPNGQPVRVDTGYKMRCEFLDREPSRLIVQKNPDNRGQHNVQFEIPLNITGGEFVHLLRAIADQAAQYLEVQEREHGKSEAQGPERHEGKAEGESGEEEAVPEDPELDPA